MVARVEAGGPDRGQTVNDNMYCDKGFGLCSLSSGETKYFIIAILVAVWRKD